MRGDFYVLDGHEVVRLEDADLGVTLRRWAAFFDQDELRIVARTTIGDATVSTVFLGMDHSFMGGPPLLFETMIFGGRLSQYQRRYSTWDEAAAGHDRAVSGIVMGVHPDEVEEVHRG